MDILTRSKKRPCRNEKGSPESEPAFGVRAAAYPRVRGGGGGEGGEQP